MLNPEEEISNEKDSVVLGASLGRNAQILDPALARVPEFYVIDGHDISEEEIANAFAKSGRRPWNLDLQEHRKDLVAKAGPLKLIQRRL